MNHTKLESNKMLIEIVKIETLKDPLPHTIIGNY